MAFEHLLPTIRIDVEGIELDVEITKFITKCTVEQTQEMADKITLTVLNAQEDLIGTGYTGLFAFTDSTVFQPGNVIKVYMGYGSDEELVGAGIIQKFLPKFPENGAAMLTIIAYDGSILMMDGESAREGAVWEDTSHSDVVLSVANNYAFISQVETTEAIQGVATGAQIRVGIEKQTTKKRGMTDWELINGLARLHGYYAKVRWNDNLNSWELFWGPDIFEQDKQYTFVYSLDGQGNTLLSFNPTMAISGIPSAVKVLYFDSDTRTWEEVELKEEDEGESVKFTGPKALEDEITSSTKYRIASSGVAVEIIPGVHFDTAEDAQLFAERFFRARKDQFIQGQGKTVGLEKLKAGQAHFLEGVGTQLSGEYQFTTVRHIFDAKSGYTCEFYANKVVS